ncbi:MAG TPA: hypothetical protein VGR45_12420 [Stellaceae bacterium]|nr:hypothetical protein [Stellaceae bacterium]
MIVGLPLVFTQFVVCEPRTAAIIAKDESGINKIEDLVGKSVAVDRSSLDEFPLVAGARKAPRGPLEGKIRLPEPAGRGAGAHLRKGRRLVDVEPRRQHREARIQGARPVP